MKAVEGPTCSFDSPLLTQNDVLQPFRWTIGNQEPAARIQTVLGRQSLRSVVIKRKVLLMMVVSREVGQAIRFEVPGQGEVRVFVAKVLDESAVHLEIEAARTLPIYRGEVWEAIERGDEQELGCFL